MEIEEQLSELKEEIKKLRGTKGGIITESGKLSSEFKVIESFNPTKDPGTPKTFVFENRSSKDKSRFYPLVPAEWY